MAEVKISSESWSACVVHTRKYGEAVYNNMCWILVLPVHKEGTGKQLLGDAILANTSMLAAVTSAVIADTVGKSH